MNKAKGALLPLFIIAIILLFNSSINSATIGWINASGGNWNNPSNWSSGTVPTSTDDVIINLTDTFTIVLDMNATINSLTLGYSSGAQTLRSTDWYLIVNGNITINAGGIIDFTRANIQTSGNYQLDNYGTMKLYSSTVDHKITNYGTMHLLRTCTFANDFENAATGEMTLEGTYESSATLTADSSFINSGTINLTSSWIVTTTTATIAVPNDTLVNDTTGIIDAQLGESLSNDSYRRLEAHISNSGTILASTASLTIYRVEGVHTNSGILHAQGGDINFGSTVTDISLINTGTIQIDDNGEFTFYDGDFWFNSGSILNNGTMTFIAADPTFTQKFTNNGRIEFSGMSSYFTINDTLTNMGTIYNSTGTINGSAPLLNQDSLIFQNSSADCDVINEGIILATIHGSINGTLTTAPGSEIVVEGTTLNNGIFSTANGYTNHGDIILTQSDAHSSYISVIDLSDSIINAVDGTIYALAGAGSPQMRYINTRLHNDGTINVTDNDLTVMLTNATHSNLGTINVMGGNLYFDGNFSNSGIIDIDTARYVICEDMKVSLNSGSITGKGTFSMIGDTVSITGTVNNEAIMNLASSQVNNSGTMNNSGTLKLSVVTFDGLGSVINNGRMTMYNSALNNDYDNQGVLTVSRLNYLNDVVTTGIGDTIRIRGDSYGSASLTCASGFTNNGIIELTSDVTDTATTATFGVTSGTLTNGDYGVILAENGNSTGGTRILAAKLNNQGVMNINNINLRMNRTTVSHANNGTINISSGKFYLDLGGTYSFNNTGVINFSNLMTMTVTGGTFNNSITGKITGNGSLNTYAAAFTNEGRISPGNSAGMLTMQANNFPVGTNAHIDIELGGTGAITEYDVLNATQNANLGGVLNIDLINDFIPAVGDSFRVLTYNARIGNFLAILGMEQLGIVFDTNFTADALYIVTKEVNNNAPVITAMPDSISFITDSTALLGIWNYVSDDYTSDSDMVYEFTVSNDSLLYNLNEAGFLVLSAEVGFTGDVTLGLTVTDQHGAFSSDTTIVSVVPHPNTPPVLTGLVDSVSFASDESYDIDLWSHVSDTESDDSLLDYSFTVSNDSLVPAYDTTAGMLNVFAIIGYNGTAYLYIDISDPDGLSVSDTVKFVITYNNPPEIIGLPDSISFKSDSLAQVDIFSVVSDVESHDTLLIYAFDTSNDSLVPSFEAPTGMLTLAAIPGFTGEASLFIAITDPDSAIAHDTIIVTVLSPLDVEQDNDLIPVEYSLYQNYPNPFNPNTLIRYSIPKRSLVNITVFDITGRQVRTLENTNRRPGHYSVEWDGTDQSGNKVASGIYLYRMTAGNYSENCKMLLLK